MASNILTQARLKELLQYDPNTGGFTWRVNRPRVKAGCNAGTLDSKQYRRISIDAKVYLAHRLAWLYMYGEWPATELDHINRNRNDNRIGNLRLADRSINTQNCNQRVDNVSGHRGVGWHKLSQRWRARISVRNKVVNLGSFHTFDEAVQAYKAYADQHHVR